MFVPNLCDFLFTVERRKRIESFWPYNGSQPELFGNHVSHTGLGQHKGE